MSFEVHDHAAVSVELKTAILLYESRGGNGSMSYATVHPVDCNGSGHPVIRAGRPADQAVLKSVCSSLLKSSRTRTGVLSDNVLSVGIESVVWWQRPGVRTYFFDCNPAADGGFSVGKRAGKAPAPGIVFVSKGQSLWGFAVEGDSRPSADTQLYHLPTMNVWETGKVCTGSMPIPDGTLSESIMAWEQSFWGSNFSHPNHPKVVKYRGGIHKFSAALLDGKFKTFPEHVLRPIDGLTLGALVDQLDGLDD